MDGALREGVRSATSSPAPPAMFARLFQPEQFLRSVYGTEPFADYCRRRNIPFEQTLSSPPWPGDHRRWAAALAELSHEQHAQVELELATVNDMAGAEAVAHLVEAADEGELPPDSVPSGTPLALWFFLHHPLLFHEVFLHQDIPEGESWGVAQAPPRLVLPNLDDSATALAEALRTFFQVRAAGRFCSVNAHRLPEGVCFAGQVADRLQFFDTFTEDGQPMTQRLRPALPVFFVYHPDDGTVLLKSPLRSRDRIARLFALFGQTVLGSPVACEADAFDLDILKRPFHPLPDAPDMEQVCVNTLHLREPARAGQRQLKLEVLPGDGMDAIEQLLHSHIDPITLARLRVSYAELQVRLRLAGGSKNYRIRLWPNRCNLSQTPLGNRFRDCLRRWGLWHARES